MIANAFDGNIERCLDFARHDKGADEYLAPVGVKAMPEPPKE